MRAALLPLLLALPLAAQTGPCTVQGRVLRAGDNAPVPHARLFFRTTSSSTPLTLGYFSSDDGSFTATGLEPAPYSLTVRRRGLLAAPSSPTSVNLSANCHAANLVLTLSPAATLAGRVSAPPSLTSTSIRVEAQRRAWINGRWHYRTVSAAQAAPTGEFRLPDLPAGAYILRAWPANPQSVSFRGAGGPDESVAPTYYPGALLSAQARPIPVASGTEVAGLDFSLLLTPYFRVSGRVLSAEGLKSPAACSVTLTSSPPGLTLSARYRPEDGTFQFPEVPPGDYDLLAYSVETANIGSATRRITVSGADLEALDIALDPPATLKAKVTSPAPIPQGTLHLRLRPQTLRDVEEEPVSIPEDGEVEFTAFLKDRYRLEFTTKTPGIYLRSITLSGRPHQGTILDLTEIVQPGALVIHLANDGSPVEGIATGAEVASQSYAVLVPADLSRLANATLLTAQISIDGRFRFPVVPPGDYLAYAFTQPLGQSFQLNQMLQDPAWVPTFQGPPVTLNVQPRQPVKLQLSTQPPP